MPLWATVLFALLPLIVSVAKLLHDLAGKNLSYQVGFLKRVLSVGEQLQGQLELHYDGRPVEDPHLFTVDIKNSGGLPIKTEDYEQPIAIVLDVGSQVLSAEVSDSNRKGLARSIGALSHHANRVDIPKMLLNRGDSFTVKVLAQHPPGQVDVVGRICGVPDIKEYNDDRRILMLTFGMGGAACLVGIGWLLYVVSWTTVAHAVIPIIFIVEGVVLLVIGSFVKAMVEGRTRKTADE